MFADMPLHLAHVYDTIMDMFVVYMKINSELLLCTDVYYFAATKMCQYVYSRSGVHKTM